MDQPADYEFSLRPHAVVDLKHPCIQERCLRGCDRRLGPYGPRRQPPKFDLQGVRGGIDRKFDNLLLGVAITYLTGGVSESGFQSDISSVSGDFYGSMLFGRAFVNWDVGFGNRSLDNIARATGFGPETATGSTRGSQFSAAAEAGFVYNIGNVALIPTGRLTWLSSAVNGYDESANILAYHISGRELSGLLGGVRLRAATPVSPWSLPTMAYAEIGYEGWLNVNSDPATVQLLNNTALPTSVNIDDPTAPGIQLKVGVNSKVSEFVQLDAQYGVALQDGDGVVQTGRLRVKVPF